MTAALLRVFLSEGQRSANTPLYAAVVDELIRHGFRGATVLKGIEGFGIRGHVRSARVVDFAGDMPVVIEVIDSEEKVRHILPRLQDLVPEGLVTLQEVEYVPITRDAP